MQSKTVKRYLTIFSWLPKYLKSYSASDIGAGITVGILLIPLGMTYAIIAGLPPVFGLYAALMPQITYAIMGYFKVISCRTSSHGIHPCETILVKLECFPQKAKKTAMQM